MNVLRMDLLYVSHAEEAGLHTVNVARGKLTFQVVGGAVE